MHQIFNPQLKHSKFHYSKKLNFTLHPMFCLNWHASPVREVCRVLFMSLTGIWTKFKWLLASHPIQIFQLICYTIKLFINNNVNMVFLFTVLYWELNWLPHYPCVHRVLAVCHFSPGQLFWRQCSCQDLHSVYIWNICNAHFSFIHYGKYYENICCKFT